MFRGRATLTVARGSAAAVEGLATAALVLAIVGEEDVGANLSCPAQCCEPGAAVRVHEARVDEVESKADEE